MSSTSPSSSARKAPLALLLLGLLCANFASAQLNISGPRDLTYAPGAQHRVTYEISNDSDAPLEALIFTQDALQLPDGAITYLPAGSLPQSLHPLLSLDVTEALVPARGSVTIPATIAVPTTHQGGYWGVIGVDARPDPLDDAQLGLRVRYAMITKLNVEGAHREVTLHQLHATPNRLAFSLENRGVTYERATVQAELHASTGATTTLERAIVIHPGNLLQASLDLPAGLAAGAYGAQVTLLLDDLPVERHVLSFQHQP